MAIAFRAIGTECSVNNSATYAVTCPTVEPNDILLALFSVRDQTAMTTVPSGWNLVPVQGGSANPADGGTDARIFAYYKVADGSEDGTTPTWVFAASNNGLAYIAAYSGCDTSDPFDVDGVSSSVAGTALAVPTIVTATANAMAIVMVGADNESTDVALFAWPGSLVERIDAESAVSNIFLGMAEEARPTAGSWAPGDVTADESDTYALLSFGLKQGAASVSVTPATLALALTLFAPTVLSPGVIVPATLALTFTMFAPNANVSLVPPIRAAFYYPWFTVGGDPGFPGAWTQLGISPYTQYQPALGYYDSADAATMDAHIDALEYGNFEAVIYSWWGQGSREDNILDNFLARLVAVGSQLKVAVYYEAEGNTVGGVSGSPDPTTAQITSDLDYLTANYTSHPNYMKVANKPVIFAYGGPEDGGQIAAERPTKRWALAIAAADEPWYDVLKVYVDYTLEPDQPDSWHQYGPATAVDQQGTYSYSISPGYWFATSATPLLARDLSAWATNVTNMLGASVDWKLVTSFNEFGEGHPVENVDGNSGRDYTGPGWDSASGYGDYLDVLHFDGAISDVTVTPTTLSLTITTFAPTVSTPRVVTPGTLALTLTAFAPSIVLGTVVTPPTLALVLVGFAPTIVTPVLVAPATLALTLALFAPSVQTPVVVQPYPVNWPGEFSEEYTEEFNHSLMLELYEPTIEIEVVSDNVTVTPATLALALTFFAPTIVTPVTVTPGTLALTLAFFAPNALTPAVATPATLALVLTTYAPTVVTSELITVTPDTLVLVITAYAPSLALPGQVTPATLALVISPFAPTVSTPVSLTPATLALLIAAFAPTVQTPVVLTPLTLALTIALFAPAVLTPRVVSPGVLVLQITPFAPSVVVSFVVTPLTLALVLTAFAPTVAIGLLVIHSFIDLLGRSSGTLTLLGEEPEPALIGEEAQALTPTGRKSGIIALTGHRRT